MDEMNITSKFMTKIVSDTVSKALEKKLGTKVYLELNEIKVRFDGAKAFAHIDVNAEMRTADIIKLKDNFR